MGKPYEYNRVMIGQGAALDPKTIPAGTTGQILTQVTTGVEPVFAPPALVNLSTGVTGTLPVANGGTGQTVGAVTLCQFWAIAAAGVGTTTFLGAGGSLTEADVVFPAPLAGTVTFLAAVASAAPGGTDTFQYRLRINGTNSGNLVTTTGAALASSGVQSAANTVVATDKICVRLQTSATAAAANHMVAIAIQVTG